MVLLRPLALVRIGVQCTWLLCCKQSSRSIAWHIINAAAILVETHLKCSHHKRCTNSRVRVSADLLLPRRLKKAGACLLHTSPLIRFHNLMYMVLCTGSPGKSEAAASTQLPVRCLVQVSFVSGCTSSITSSRPLWSRRACSVPVLPASREIS